MKVLYKLFTIFGVEEIEAYKTPRKVFNIFNRYLIAFPDIIKQNLIHFPTYISQWMVHWLKWSNFHSIIPSINIYLSQDLPFSPGFSYIGIINEVIHNISVYLRVWSSLVLGKKYYWQNWVFSCPRRNTWCGI